MRPMTSLHCQGHCAMNRKYNWKCGGDNWRAGTVSTVSQQFLLAFNMRYKTVTWNEIFYSVPTIYVLRAEQHADIRMSWQPFCSLLLLLSNSELMKRYDSNRLLYNIVSQHPVARLYIHSVFQVLQPFVQRCTKGWITWKTEWRLLYVTSIRAGQAVA
jgi:hypothetical protein